MSEAVPILAVHRGNSGYLRYWSAQARQSNPRSRIVLIGDATNELRDTEHAEWTDYLGDDGEEFTRSYQHLSSLRFEFELFCMQRWFVIAHFMRRHGIPWAFVMDTDVLLFSDVSELPRESGFATAGDSGHVALLDARMAASFARFILDAYTRPDRLTALRAVYRSYCEVHAAGGICDMTHIAHFRQANAGRVSSLLTIGDGVFDDNINAPGGFTQVAGVKALHGMGGKVLGRRADDGRLVRFHGVHFQGVAKSLMSYAAAGDWRGARRMARINLLKTSAIRLASGVRRAMARSRKYGGGAQKRTGKFSSAGLI